MKEGKGGSVVRSSLLDVFDEQIQTIPQMLYNNKLYLGSYPATVFMEEGQVKEVSYSELVTRAECIAIALLKLGIGVADRIGSISVFSNRWIWADLGIVFSGGIPVKMPETIHGEQLQAMICEHSMRAIVVSDEKQVQEVLDCLSSVPAVTYVICLQKGFRGDGFRTFGLGELIYMGAISHETLLPHLQSVLEEIDSDSIASIIYLSEEKGKTNASAYSHKKILSTCTKALRYLNRLAQSTHNEELKQYATMPVHQIMGKIQPYIWPMIMGACLDFSAPDKVVKGQLDEIMI
jgi:long-subunit acyl-CoA synthetase (AMP-forming)